MSALIAYVRGANAHIITDGAATTPGGWFGRLTPKVLPVPHLGIAVAGRGSLPIVRRLMWYVSTFASQAELRQALPAALAKTYGWRARLLPWVYRFDLLIVGTDGTAGFAFLVSSIPHPGMKPFQLLEVDSLFASPQVDDDRLRMILDRLDGDKSALFADGERALADLLDIQRENGRVGGFGQITTIGSRGIVTRIFKRWPDQVGDYLRRARQRETAVEYA
ncbi:hypothetical protein [Rhizobium sp. FY34]|uniref:hypothetical protein n=1 Tax=Rhizobium sp. FY34 TaxID=2562309 RepID=UPI0010C04B2B|nr:hypothetical protein [Rhizobium sp. FY34]